MQTRKLYSMPCAQAEVIGTDSCSSLIGINGKYSGEIESYYQDRPNKGWDFMLTNGHSVFIPWDRIHFWDTYSKNGTVIHDITLYEEA